MEQRGREIKIWVKGRKYLGERKIIANFAMRNGRIVCSGKDNLKCIVIKVWLSFSPLQEVMIPMQERIAAIREIAGCCGIPLFHILPLIQHQFPPTAPSPLPALSDLSDLLDLSDLSDNSSDNSNNTNNNNSNY